MGLSYLEGDVDVTFGCVEPYIPEEKDLLFTLIYFGKVILFDCLYNLLDWLTEWVSELVSGRVGE